MTPSQLTQEQQTIIYSTGNLKINAVAGSGKTTTLLLYAAQQPAQHRILYLAFNKSVRLEAQKKFAEKGLNQVTIETAHSLAFKQVVLRSHYKIRQKDFSSFEIAELLGLRNLGSMNDPYIIANHILKFTNYFCNSAASKVANLNYLDLISEKAALKFATHYYTAIEQGTRVLLAKMKAGDIEITHDFYLKLFQLSNPVLPYDCILFDEGQDASPAMLDIFLKQKSRKIIVGDTHQQIYSWRHAVNSLEKTDFSTCHLSTSFRFNQTIADLALQFLSWKEHIGNFSRININGKENRNIIRSKAIIARTNLGLLQKAIQYVTYSRKINGIYFEGHLNSYTYADDGTSLYDVLNLYNRKNERIRDKLLHSMSTIDDLEEYIEQTGDGQLLIMVELVRTYENELPDLLQKLRNLHVADEDKDKAQQIFSTVHRAKGMEYDSVELANDFITEAELLKFKEKKQLGEEVNTDRLNEEINLLYVAVTRTRNRLYLPEDLRPALFQSSPNIQFLKSTRKERDGKNGKKKEDD